MLLYILVVMYSLARTALVHEYQANNLYFVGNNTMIVHHGGGAISTWGFNMMKYDNILNIIVEYAYGSDTPTGVRGAVEVTFDERKEKNHHFYCDTITETRLKCWQDNVYIPFAGDHVVKVVLYVMPCEAGKVIPMQVNGHVAGPIVDYSMLSDMMSRGRNKDITVIAINDAGVEQGRFLVHRYVLMLSSEVLSFMIEQGSWAVAGKPGTYAESIKIGGFSVDVIEQCLHLLNFGYTDTDIDMTFAVYVHMLKFFLAYQIDYFVNVMLSKIIWYIYNRPELYYYRMVLDIFDAMYDDKKVGGKDSFNKSVGMRNFAEHFAFAVRIAFGHDGIKELLEEDSEICVQFNKDNKYMLGFINAIVDVDAEYGASIML